MASLVGQLRVHCCFRGKNLLFRLQVGETKHSEDFISNISGCALLHKSFSIDSHPKVPHVKSIMYFVLSDFSRSSLLPSLDTEDSATSPHSWRCNSSRGSSRLVVSMDVRATSGSKRAVVSG
jgi:hypothetical protein